MTAPALVDQTIVHRMIMGLLTPLQTGDASSIDVKAPHEDPPSSDDEGSAAFWCRLNPVRLDARPRNRGSAGADLKIATITVTVGVSDDALRSNPRRLTHTMQTVAAVLDSASATHAATTHTMQIDEVSNDPQNTGEHNGQLIGVLTASAVVQRISGRTATLSPT
jgi:hypothetical protein